MRKSRLTTIFKSLLTVAIATLVLVYIVKAGNLDPSSSPADTMKTLDDIFHKNTGSAGSYGLNPPGSPASTMHTLQEIYDMIPAYSNQSLVEKDDYAAGDYTGEESAWTNPCPVASANCSEDVYKDGRTGLYWSSSQGQADNNNFTISTCAFFTTEPRGNYDGSDSDCQDNPTGAINMCGLLSIDANDDGVDETDWYLPSQKELQQAYIDGMYNQAGSTFTTDSFFWSSTEDSYYSDYAWYVYLGYGAAGSSFKTNASGYVRCVRRD